MWIGIIRNLHITVHCTFHYYFLSQPTLLAIATNYSPLHTTDDFSSQPTLLAIAPHYSPLHTTHDFSSQPTLLIGHRTTLQSTAYHSRLLILADSIGHRTTLQSTAYHSRLLIQADSIGHRTTRRVLTRGRHRVTTR